MVIAIRPDAELRYTQITLMGRGTTFRSKQHFAVLDGLRGSAALSVVLFHIQAIAVGWEPKRQILPHAYLAVDFFFLLSGFVIGYAYDDRWSRLSLRGFFMSRLIRLHPLAVLGTVLGLASYLFDPFAAGSKHSPAVMVAIALPLSLLLLPSPPLAGRWSDTHPFNGPAWTLLQEYVANIAYALVLRRLSTWALSGLAVVAGIVLTACAVRQDTLDLGSAWENIWMAPVRLAFPFLTGLVIVRLRHRLPRIQIGYLPLTLILLAIFLTPVLPVTGVLKETNGLFTAFCVIVVFPLVVIVGAHSNTGWGAQSLCRASGRISYPLYITHFPFVYIWANYLVVAHPSTRLAIEVGVTLAVFMLAFAWAAYSLWDVPIRKRLSALREIHTS